MARAAGAEPQAGGTAERGRQADGVPVAERLAQARVDLVGVQRAREDLGQQRVAADDRGRQRASRRAGRASARASGARARRPATATARKLARAVGLEPGVRRVDGPDDRERGEQQQQRERGERQAAPEAPRVAAGDERRGGEQPPRARRRPSRPRSSGSSCRPPPPLRAIAARTKPSGDRDGRVARQARDRQPARQRPRVSRSGGRGQGSTAAGRRRRGRTRPSAESSTMSGAGTLWPAPERWPSAEGAGRHELAAEVDGLGAGLAGRRERLALLGRRRGERVAVAGRGGAGVAARRRPCRRRSRRRRRRRCPTRPCRRRRAAARRARSMTVAAGRVLVGVGRQLAERLGVVLLGVLAVDLLVACRRRSAAWSRRRRGRASARAGTRGARVLSAFGA